jgi:hypothetical protein
MITQYEVPSLIRAELPLKETVYPINIAVAIYRSVHNFTSYTRQAVQEHHLNTVKKCFQLAERLYQSGDNIVKLCIENILIYSISSFMPQDKAERLMLQSFIPATLNKLYIRQVAAAGC